MVLQQGLRKICWYKGGEDPVLTEHGRVMGSKHHNPATKSEDYWMMKGRFANDNNLEKQDLDWLIEQKHMAKYHRLQDLVEEDQQTNQESQERI